MVFQIRDLNIEPRYEHGYQHLTPRFNEHSLRDSDSLPDLRALHKDHMALTLLSSNEIR
jgi:hypothetical protein